ncbi:MAG: glutamate--tRNA ligase [Thermoplasmatota archaeon]
MSEVDLEAVVRKHALRNAIEHGRADPKAVSGRVLAERAEFRARAKEVAAIAATVVAEVNAMPADGRSTALASLEAAQGPSHPAAHDIASQPERTAGSLPMLPNAEKGRVVMRFAPNPSGPATLGHARGMTIHWEYKTHYGAKLILRFDDTDPTVKRPMLEAYEWIPEDFRWLCGEPDETIAASERMPLYYRHAEIAIDHGAAYICECEAQVFRDLKEQGLACPHRSQTKAESRDKWHKMAEGGYKPGEAVLRIRTDINHANPALRDWVGIRIARDPHPKVGTQYPAWPLLDFQSAVDDHLTGVTHIIRGKDLRDSTLKQGFLYDALGWKYPNTLYWGRASVHEFGKFSKSILSEAIARGEYEGWDDPRLPTLRALRRRGFRAEAIRSFWLSFGLSEKDVAASMKTLEAENRKVIEPVAARYFFVESPTPIRIVGAPALAAEPPLHPDHPERGVRRLALTPAPDGSVRVEIAAEDGKAITQGSRIRLKDLANLEFEDSGTARYVGNDLAFLKTGARIIQWVPPDGVPTTLRMPTGESVSGLAERDLASERPHAIVQLERIGFARLDSVLEGDVRLYFTHK